MFYWSIFICNFFIFSCALAKLSLEEKIGQLLIVHFHGEVANEESLKLIEQVKVGGFIYYNWANGLQSPEKVKALSQSLQSQAEKCDIMPLFISVDQEGGVVARLQEGFTEFPGNMALGRCKNSSYALASAYAIGEQLRYVGVNLNFSPVVDINSNSRNPIIGVRSFGDNAELVTKLGAETLRGYNQAGIISCLKHYPGHGDVEIDSHEELPILPKSLESLENLELVPFKALASKAETIMTAHILAPAIDKEYCATFSRKWLGYLKEKLGFQGLIISDSLVMQGALKQAGCIDEAAILALNAGCDVLVLGGRQLTGSSVTELTVFDIERIHKSLISAVKTGRVSEERIDEAFKKIRKLKKRFSLTSKKNMPFTDYSILAKKIAEEALEIDFCEAANFKPLSQKKVNIFFPKVLENKLFKTEIATLGKSRAFYCLEEQLSENSFGTADVAIIFTHNSWKEAKQINLVNKIAHIYPTILVVTRDPYDSDLILKAAMRIKTFSPSTPSLQAACELLSRKL